jgi:hypothetical protein
MFFDALYIYNDAKLYKFMNLQVGARQPKTTTSYV